MKIQLALYNLAHNRPRTIVAATGVSFAVILIFMQLGFLGATRKTATMIYDRLDFDIVLRSPAYVHLCDARWFPRTRLQQAAALPGVESVAAFYVGLQEWRHPKTGANRAIMIMGMAPEHPVFRDATIIRESAKLGEGAFVLIDSKSKKEYGPSDGERFGDEDIGLCTAIGNQQVQIVGHFELGSGFAANGAVLTSDVGFSRVAPAQSIQDVNLGLLTVRDKADIPKVKRQLNAMFERQHDVVALTREEATRAERQRWVWDTSIGLIFLLGVVVAVVVGVVIVNQVLSTDVANLLHEYATLKAMGYTDGYLTRVIVQQGVLLAFLGFAIGFVVAWIMYVYVGQQAGIPMLMTWRRAAGVLFLANAICVVSGLLASRKLRVADPADLF